MTSTRASKFGRGNLYDHTCTSSSHYQGIMLLGHVRSPQVMTASRKAPMEKNAEGGDIIPSIYSISYVYVHRYRYIPIYIYLSSMYIPTCTTGCKIHLAQSSRVGTSDMIGRQSHLDRRNSCPSHIIILSCLPLFFPSMIHPSSAAAGYIYSIFNG